MNLEQKKWLSFIEPNVIEEIKLKKIKIRDEQKGVIFIALIFVIVISLTVVFSLTLRSNVVEENLKSNEVVRTLFIVENEDNGALFSSVLIYVPSSYKAAIVNVPGYTGAIYQSLGRVDRIDKVYEEVGISLRPENMTETEISF